MTKERLLAFSDGMIAIFITIMVLELKVPAGADWAALEPVLEDMLIYVLSFVFLAIYWNNHHHLFQLTHRVNGAILWANMHLLFWLSLVPFVTAWLSQNHFAAVPTATYAVLMLLSAIAYTILARMIIADQGEHSELAAALGKDRKGKISLSLYAAAVPLAFFQQWMADLCFVTVALIWLVPDRRIEQRVQKQ